MKKKLANTRRIAISKNFDLYQEVTSKIIVMIDQGVTPW